LIIIFFYIMNIIDYMQIKNIRDILIEHPDLLALFEIVIIMINNRLNNIR
jgi:hypothetical protein